MNNQEAAQRIAALIDRHGMDEAMRILAGDPPAGSDHRLVGRHAERAGNKTLTDSADSSRVGRAEGRVPLVQLQFDLMSEAAELERFSHDSVAFTPIQLEDFAERAAGKRAQLAALAELLGAPRPKSDGEEGESEAVPERWLGTLDHAAAGLRSSAMMREMVDGDKGASVDRHTAATLDEIAKFLTTLRRR